MLLTEAFSYWAASAPRRDSTLNRYGASIRRLSEIGFRTLDDVTLDRVLETQRRLLARGLEVVSIRTEFAALHCVLGLLETHQKFPSDRLASIRRVVLKAPRRRTRRHRIRHLNWFEVEHLAQTAERYEPRIELPIRVASLAGPRTGELARIRGEDYHDDGCLEIESLPEWGEAGSCKTGPRTVSVCEELDKLLRERLPRVGWLFPSGTLRGRAPATPFLSRWTLETGLARVRRLADLPDDVTFTILRHTRAAWWLQDGRSIYKVADWLGHTVETCEASYGSLLDGYDPDCERRPALPQRPDLVRGRFAR